MKIFAIPHIQLILTFTLLVISVPIFAVTEEYQRALNETAAAVSSGQMTRLQQARILHQTSRTSDMQNFDEYNEEYFLYYEFLANKVDTEGMSIEELRYLMNQKLNEVNQKRQMANNSSNLYSKPPEEKRIDYRCRSDCMAKGYLYKFCVSKCGY